MVRKLAHIRSLGYTPRHWDTPRYITPGLSLSHSVYDMPELAGDDFENDSQYRAGIHTERERLPVKELTSTRNPRIAAQFSSAAQAHSWQGGWQTRWSHMMMRPNIAETRTLTQNNNRNAYGRAEQQRATIYNPWPSAGALFPKAV